MKITVETKSKKQITVPNPKYKIGDIVIFRKEYSSCEIQQVKIAWAEFCVDKTSSNRKTDTWLYFGQQECASYSTGFAEREIIKKIN